MPTLLGQGPAWTLRAPHFGFTSSDKCRSRQVTGMCETGGPGGPVELLNVGPAWKHSFCKVLKHYASRIKNGAHTDCRTTWRSFTAHEAPSPHPLLWACCFSYTVCLSVFWLPHPSSAWLIPSGTKTQLTGAFPQEALVGLEIDFALWTCSSAMRWPPPGLLWACAVCCCTSPWASRGVEEASSVLAGWA